MFSSAYKWWMAFVIIEIVEMKAHRNPLYKSKCNKALIALGRRRR